MKKVICFIFAIAVSFAITGCTKVEDQIYLDTGKQMPIEYDDSAIFGTIDSAEKKTQSENSITMRSDASNIPFDFNEIVSYSTNIVDAEYSGVYTSEYGRELLKFIPLTILKGNIASNIIYVQPFLESITNSSTEYSVGSTYMLFLEKNSSVYYEYDIYVQLGELTISSDAEYWEQYHLQTQSSLLEFPDLAPLGYGIAYTKSTNIRDILRVTDNIFEVNIVEEYAKSEIAPTTVYRCNVIKTIMNTPVDSGNILLTLFNGTVEVGNAYVVMLADATETANIYTLSSLNSVYTLEEAATIPELAELLDNAAIYETIPNTITDDEIFADEQAAIAANY